jgi:hypothetical protein
MTYDNSPRPGEPHLERAMAHTEDGDDGVARPWMLLVGVALVVVGILGFVDNPLVGRNGLFMTGTVHNVVHLVTGILALAIGMLHGQALGQGTIAYGALYAAVLVLTVISPTLFGILEMPVNAADHVLHAILAAGSVAAGYTALGTGRAII